MADYSKIFAQDNKNISSLFDTGNLGSDLGFQSSYSLGDGAGDSIFGDLFSNESIDKFGKIAGGIGDLASLYGSFGAISQGKKNYKLAKEDSLFSKKFDIAGLLKTIDDQNAIRGFFGNDEKLNANQYLDQGTLDKYGSGATQIANQSAPTQRPSLFGGALPQIGGLNNSAPIQNKQSLFPNTQQNNIA